MTLTNWCDSCVKWWPAIATNYQKNYKPAFCLTPGSKSQCPPCKYSSFDQNFSENSKFVLFYGSEKLGIIAEVTKDPLRSSLIGHLTIWNLKVDFGAFLAFIEKKSGQNHNNNYQIKKIINLSDCWYQRIVSKFVRSISYCLLVCDNKVLQHQVSDISPKSNIVLFYFLRCHSIAFYFFITNKPSIERKDVFLKSRRFVK